MPLTNLLVPTYAQMLRGLSGWLDKAQKQLPKAEAEALLSARLAPDMYPLSSQVSFACFQALEATYRLRGESVPDALKQIAADGQNAAERPGSIANAQGRISETITFLNTLDANSLDAGAEQQISLELPTGMIFDMTGEQYARDWALAQFYFHLITAYAILRNQKIELGKADYVPHMFAYLRPETMPQD
ncbi:DUF1993 domain-containing protein [Flexibacterium corallicola]|uniref:DUF1993 domain-containing protein n=1 Tax=Flexibacterium corallicola TaxID=3037259 RepID=UPI00286EE4F2|nr:DUF1993 domain-containing protein [Pseudovibrio sp. M1P-2-3]